eukprot:714386-Prorocentrum_minimum.AAC.1
MAAPSKLPAKNWGESNSPVVEWPNKGFMSASSKSPAKNWGESNSPVVEWPNKGLMAAPGPFS